MNAKNLNVSLSHGVNVYSNPTCQHFLIARTECKCISCTTAHYFVPQWNLLHGLRTESVMESCFFTVH